MNRPASMEQEYLKLLQHILDKGDWQENRTGIPTLGVFGYQMRCDLAHGFPLLTTKKLPFRIIAEELLWFIAGGTNAYDLIEKNVRIWDEWTPAYKAGGKEAVQKAFDEGDTDALELGPVYGAQWRAFGQKVVNGGPMPGYDVEVEGVDQFKNLIERIKTNPQCRRLILNAWNPHEIDNMALPPCHVMMQFRVSGGRLHLQMYQRSADVFLGVPFNIASYALLLKMVALMTGYQAGEFIHTFGDVHIYQNHLEQIKEQLTRVPFTVPGLAFKRKPESIFDFKYEDFDLIGYAPHPAIKAEVAV